MKYVVILGDGMADYKQPFLDNKTPLDLANKPTIDGLCAVSEMGLVRTIPDGMKPGSDVANLSVLGYDVKAIYTGRSPLEAASIGIELKDTDVTARANLVTLSDEEVYEDKTMIDYSAGEISTSEAKELIEYLASHLNDDKNKFYAGISYRHCLVRDKGEISNNLTPPHDITGKPIKEYLPKDEKSKIYVDLMKKSADLLKDHPVNLKRKKEGKRVANSLWFWGEGTKPQLENYKQKFGVSGGMISAVDLLKGIGMLSGMKVIEVDGATGNIDTNFEGKAEKCIEALKNGLDFVYIHMEAPDECGHHGDSKNKISSIEQIDQKVVKKVIEELENMNEPFSILICPDHPTPLSTMTHAKEPVPYIIYRSNKVFEGKKGAKYCETEAESTGIYIENSRDLMKKFIKEI